MNNKGQSLVTFVLILPLLVLFMAFVIDSLLSIKEKNKLDGIIQNNLEIALNKNITNEDRIIQAIKENDKDISVITEINDIVIKIKGNEKKKNIFGNLVKLDWYNLEVIYCGNYESKKIERCEW